MINLLGGAPIFDWPDLLKLLVRLALDVMFVTVVVRFIYYRVHRNRALVLTYYLFNVVTLFMCLLLRKVPTELGLALALFGVFGILRYRTEQIRIHDLTYLFIVIGIGLLNGVANKSISVVELLVVNGVIIAMTAILELVPWRNSERSALVVYDQLDFLRPGNEDKLLADLTVRTGLRVTRVEVQEVDFLRDSAHVTVFCRSDSGHLDDNRTT